RWTTLMEASLEGEEATARPLPLREKVPAWRMRGGCKYNDRPPFRSDRAILLLPCPPSGCRHLLPQGEKAMDPRPRVLLLPHLHHGLVRQVHRGHVGEAQGAGVADRLGAFAAAMGLAFGGGADVDLAGALLLRRLQRGRLVAAGGGELAEHLAAPFELGL